MEACAEDCARAAVVVSAQEAPGAYAARLIDRKAWRANGAVALRWTGDRFALSAARPPWYERSRARNPLNAGESGSAPLRPAARDATPRPDELDVDD